MRRPTQNNWKGMRAAVMLSSVAATIVAATVVGYVIGAWLDRVVQTRDPWFTALFVLIGAAAGFVEMVRVISRAEKDE
ncbi:MAG: AtpZ/AtpI family protein [Armatimonadota bacterium]